MSELIGYIASDIEAFKNEADHCLKRLHMIDKTMEITPAARAEMERYVAERNDYWRRKFSKMTRDDWASFILSEVLDNFGKQCGKPVMK